MLSGINIDLESIKELIDSFFHNYGVISESHACRDCVWHIISCRALYNLPWRASVSSHQVQCSISTFEALQRKKHVPVSRKMQKI